MDGADFVDFGKVIGQVRSCNKRIHHDIMTETSTHHKEMENFVGSEIFVAGVENRKFQCVDHTAGCVDDSACEQPASAGRAEMILPKAKMQTHPIAM